MDTPRTPVRYALDLTDLTVLDPVAAHLCGWVSYYAYYDSAADLFSQALGATNIRRMPAIEATGRPQGWIIELPECFVVAWCGTANYAQLYGLLRDTFYGTLTGVPSSQLAGSVWAKHSRDIIDGWQTELLACLHAKKTLFTGHSLGGAIAACVLKSLKALDTPGAQPNTCITFGCPRLGNRALSDATIPWPNVVCPGDVVPKLPHLGYFRPLLSSSDPNLRGVWPNNGFAKHGNLYYLDAAGHFDQVERGEKANPADVGVEYDVTRALDTVLATRSGSQALEVSTKPFLQAVPLHFMGNYLRRLERNIPNVPAGSDDLNDLGTKYEVEVLAPDPTPVLTTIAQTPFPTPAADRGVKPLKSRRQH